MKDSDINFQSSKSTAKYIKERHLHWQKHLPANSGVPIISLISLPGSITFANPKSISFISLLPLCFNTIFSGYKILKKSFRWLTDKTLQDSSSFRNRKLCSSSTAEHQNSNFVIRSGIFLRRTAKKSVKIVNLYQKIMNSDINIRKWKQDVL